MKADMCWKYFDTWKINLEGERKRLDANLWVIIQYCMHLHLLYNFSWRRRFIALPCEYILNLILEVIRVYKVFLNLSQTLLIISIHNLFLNETLFFTLSNYSRLSAWWRSKLEVSWNRCICICIESGISSYSSRVNIKTPRRL